MDEFTLVSKVNSAAGCGSSKAGRPRRTSFCIRRHDGFHLISLPTGVCKNGDRIDFLLSPAGFAIRLSADGERAVYGKQTSRTAKVPNVVLDRMPAFRKGVTELVAEERPNHTWFFPFNQFLASQE